MKKCFKENSEIDYGSLEKFDISENGWVVHIEKQKKMVKKMFDYLGYLRNCEELLAIYDINRMLV